MHYQIHIYHFYLNFSICRGFFKLPWLATDFPCNNLSNSYCPIPRSWIHLYLESLFGFPTCCSQVRRHRCSNNTKWESWGLHFTGQISYITKYICMLMIGIHRRKAGVTGMGDSDMLGNQCEPGDNQSSQSPTWDRPGVNTWEWWTKDRPARSLKGDWAVCSGCGDFQSRRLYVFADCNSTVFDHNLFSLPINLCTDGHGK